MDPAAPEAEVPADPADPAGVAPAAPAVVAPAAPAAQGVVREGPVDRAGPADAVTPAPVRMTATVDLSSASSDALAVWRRWSRAAAGSRSVPWWLSAMATAG